MSVSLRAIRKGIILIAFSPAYSINYNVTGGGVVWEIGMRDSYTRVQIRSRARFLLLGLYQ